MKILLSLLLFIAAANCDNNTAAAPVTTTQTPPQDGILVGKIAMNDLRKGAHARWFEPVYKSYKPDAPALKTIQENIGDYKIILFMGTWCPDSHYQVPQFYKLLEESNYDMKNLTVYAVREDKTLPDGKHNEYGIRYVPTIIFYKNGEETGRFVEYEKESLEKDIAKILLGQPYTPAYQ